VRLSNLDSGAPYKTSAGYAFPYGDYLEIAVDPFGTSHVAWGEGTSYTGPGGTCIRRVSKRGITRSAVNGSAFVEEFMKKATLALCAMIAVTLVLAVAHPASASARRMT